MNPTAHSTRTTRIAAAAVVLLAALAGTTAALAARGTASPPVLDLTVPAVGGVRLGDSERDVARVWGKPLRTARQGSNVSKQFGYLGGRLSVYFRNGRVRIVEVQGVVRTTKGDRRGTTIAAFRRNWGGAVHPNCCAVGVRHVSVATQRGGVVYAATFRSGRLTALALMSNATFLACYVAECD